MQSINPYAPSSALRNEAAYQSEGVPATGLYSARYYEGGSTEVMSMTMEYFSQPAKAQYLLDRDPVQAAIILRAIIPREFSARVPRELQDLLPQVYEPL